MIRDQVPPPPRGRERLKWYGPGLLWMLSAVGTGSILFTPRVASVYRYELFWLLVLVVFFMWVMIREMARFSIVTGRSMLDGMHTLRGPSNWAVWLVFVPQLFAAAVGIAGLSSVVGSALASFLPGDNSIYGIVVVLLCTFFVSAGQYMKVEKLSRVMALVLMAMAIVSAVAIFPGAAPLAGGLLPQLPEEPNYYVILPWVGTILAGSMGIVWFGYWTATRGFGGGLVSPDRDDEIDTEDGSTRVDEDRDTSLQRVRDWLRVMTGAAALGVLGGLVVITAFLILGAELLAPKDLLPEGTDVAVDLARLFSEVWGDLGRYLLLAAIVIALGGSVLANQDGWGRSFADMSLILLDKQREGRISRALAWLHERSAASVPRRRFLKRLFVVVITGIIPILILIAFKDPVKVMSVSGIVAALHTPFIVLTALYVNRTRLPKELRPGLFCSISMALAGLFYIGFALIYLLDLFGLLG